ncbi:MAG: CoA-binding protein [Nitrospira bacterium SG8_3]|nr:MAG: CoA-binding protein [Nitrospira bacterium SG8_3]
MLESIKESPLYPIANPKSIAFFGASNRITSMGTNLLASVQALGFEGPIYPVHPNEKQVRNLKAYGRVFDLPEAADLAVLVLPARLVPQTVEECGKKGINRAIIVSGGFKEMGGEGVDLEQQLKEVADKYGIRFLGPNCIGVANPHHKLNTTILPHEGAPGYIGMASQSGSLVTQMFNYLSRYGLGFSTAFSVGNEANMDIVDCLEYLGACPHTRVIALYIEAIKRGRAFVDMARSIVLHKPIVAFYVGGSDTGKRASLSHTGAMAGPDLLYEGIFRQSGIIRAQSVTELFDFCWALGGLPIPRGRRVVIQTHSGGPGAAAADACGRAGLELPPLSSKTLEKLDSLLPHTSSKNNPVDLTFIKDPLQYFTDIPKVLLEDSNVDILLVYFLTVAKVIRRALEQMGIPEDQIPEQSSRLMDQQCESVVRLMNHSDKLFVGYTYRSLEDPFIRGLLRRGVPVFPEPTRAARALQALFRYSDLRNRMLDGSGRQTEEI